MRVGMNGALFPDSVVAVMEDHLGTIHEMTDSSVSVKTAYRYTPYGVRTKQGFSTMDCDFGFTGHYHHEVSGLVLTWYRAYDPDMGRWLSADPLENVTGRVAEMLSEGPNLYGSRCPVIRSQFGNNNTVLAIFRRTSLHRRDFVGSEDLEGKGSAGSRSRWIQDQGHHSKHE